MDKNTVSEAVMELDPRPPAAGEVTALSAPGRTAVPADCGRTAAAVHAASPAVAGRQETMWISEPCRAVPFVMVASNTSWAVVPSAL